MITQELRTCKHTKLLYREFHLYNFLFSQNIRRKRQPAAHQDPSSVFHPRSQPTAADLRQGDSLETGLLFLQPVSALHVFSDLLIVAFLLFLFHFLANLQFMWTSIFIGKPSLFIWFTKLSNICWKLKSVRKSLSVCLWTEQKYKLDTFFFGSNFFYLAWRLQTWIIFC